jgi:hypothetical protein
LQTGGTGQAGGGNGGNTYGASGGNASANSGSGGGGAGAGSSAGLASGGNGGSGVVIIRYLTSDFGTCTGGTKTTDGSYTVHTFNSSGTMTFVSAPSSIPNDDFMIF